MDLHYCMKCFTPLQSDGACPNCGFRREQYSPQAHYLPLETILHGRYLVGKVLGEGGFGITYVGFDLALERKVAIKEYFPNGSVWRDQANGLTINCYSTKNFAETFTVGKQNCMKEARSLAKLDDIDAVVRVLDHFLENNTAYVIMEYIDGVTLKDYVMRLPQRLTYQQVMEMLLPVMRSLCSVHQRGFIHRDISPDNIMITPDGKAKLLDFGTAKLVARGGSFTQNPTIKRGFSALEQYSTEGKLGAWTDVYAMCSTIFYLLTGSTVPEPMERLNKSTDAVRDKLAEWAPPEAQPILLSGLAVRPQDRMQTMDELVARLEETLPKPKAEGRRHLKWLLPAVGALAAAVVVLLILVLKPSGDASEKYTYGRELANLMTDGVIIADGEVTYVCDYYDADNLSLYYMDKDNVTHDLGCSAMQLNLLGDTLYFAGRTDNVIYSYTQGDSAPTQLYDGGAVGQVLAVDTGNEKFLLFTEINGAQIYLQKLDLKTNEKTTVSSGQTRMLFSVHDNLVYYTNGSYELWTVSMDGQNEECLIKDVDVYSFCFADDKIYLQTKDTVVEATMKGKIGDTLPGLDPIYQLDDRYISPLLMKEGMLYYTDKDSLFLYRYDLKERLFGTPFAKTICYNFESYGDSIIISAKETDTPTLYMIPDDPDADPDPIPLVMWTRVPQDDYSYGVNYSGNAVNGTISAVADTSLYYLYGGTLYAKKVGASSDSSVTNGTYCSCLNILDDNSIYVVATTSDGSDNIVHSKDGAVYTGGNDVRVLQYYRRDSFTKLLFTEKAQDGNYYAYSMNTDGTSKTRLSHTACDPDSLDVYRDCIIYVTADKKHVCMASVTGQQLIGSFEVYSVSGSNSSIYQASFYGSNVYVSVVVDSGSNHFISIDPYQAKVLTDQRGDIGRFVFCNGGLYATDPATEALYYYSSPKNDLTTREEIFEFRCDCLNVFKYNDTFRVLLRSKGTGNIYMVGEYSSDMKWRSIDIIKLEDLK